MSYYNFTKRPKVASNRQKITRKLDDIFSAYIRLRDADQDGIVACITCGDRYHWTEITCGHFAKRGNMSTRWHLKNGDPQCGLCNSTHDGREELHAKVIDEKYGAGTADMLDRLSKEETHFSEHELEGMYQELKAEVKAIRQEKGMI